MDLKYAVHVRNVSKVFQSGKDVVHALRDVNFDALLGELLMIVGPSGCGKTTLLSVIAGTLKFDSGEIDVIGNSLKDLPEKALTAFRKKNIGFIFQKFHLISTLSCLENVSIPLVLNGLSRSEAEGRAAEVLEMVGMKGREYDSPATFSGGQQQRIAIARALVHNPPLLICDEPTSALDAENGEKIMELLVNVAENPNRSVIIVTHDSRIFKYANRIAKMDDGKVKVVLSSKEELNT
ncbi:MAG: ABC transporter ATP-binding protein [Parachlamydiaceae bacterium]|nr:ABC transporter ATP-binding protein [Parachlamydiaceae bacterium]